MTKRQFEVLKFIDDFLYTKGYSPSFQEIADGVGLKSKSNVHRIIQALLKDNKIRMKPARARNIEVLSG